MTTANPWATFPLSSVGDQRVRMGPLLSESPAVDFWWNTQLPSGAYTIASAAGWQSTEYITPVDQVGGRDGGLFGPSSIAPRVLQVDAMLSAPTAQALHDTIERARYVLGPQTQSGARGPVVWEEYDYRSGVRLGLVTRPVGLFEPVPVPGHLPGGVAATVRFSLVAANPPWKYRAGGIEQASVGLTNPALLSGRTYDKTYNFTYGTSTNPGGQVLAVNTGNLEADVVFVVKGTVLNPIITNVTTGQSFQVLASLTDNDTVTIDSSTGSITPGTVRILGAPFKLAPGSNTIAWRGSNDAFDPDALLTLQWRSTYA
jgi:hypothetical protein